MVSYYQLALLGGDDEQAHWDKAYLTLKALDTAGKMLPTDQGALELLKSKWSGAGQ